MPVLREHALADPKQLARSHGSEPLLLPARESLSFASPHRDLNAQPCFPKGKPTSMKVLLNSRLAQGFGEHSWSWTQEKGIPSSSLNSLPSNLPLRASCGGGRAGPLQWRETEASQGNASHFCGREQQGSLKYSGGSCSQPAHLPPCICCSSLLHASSSFRVSPLQGGLAEA